MSGKIVQSALQWVRMTAVTVKPPSEWMATSYCRLVRQSTYFCRPTPDVGVALVLLKSLWDF